MKDWEKIRTGWRKDANKFAKKRTPEGCTCDAGDRQSGDWCKFCDDERRYMEAMEDHADVIGSRYKTCPF